MRDYAIVPLTKNRHTIIDAEDYDKIKNYRWCVNDKSRVPYAIASTYEGGRKGKKSISMHRVIMNAPKGMQVDHINGNGLDNRKDNLRLCTHAENMRNAKKSRNNTSGYIGVTANTDSSKYAARIDHNGKRYRTRVSTCPIETAIFRDIMALELHGEFASLNYPELRDLFTIA